MIKVFSFATELHYKHGTIHRFPGSGRPSLISQELLKLVEDQMRSNDETTSNQIVKMLKQQGCDGL